jgi:hypothetical protein
MALLSPLASAPASPAFATAASALVALASVPAAGVLPHFSQPAVNTSAPKIETRTFRICAEYPAATYLGAT